MDYLVRAAVRVVVPVAAALGVVMEEGGGVLATEVVVVGEVGREVASKVEARKVVVPMAARMVQVVMVADMVMEVAGVEVAEKEVGVEVGTREVRSEAAEVRAAAGLEVSMVEAEAGAQAMAAAVAQRAACTPSRPRAR